MMEKSIKIGGTVFEPGNIIIKFTLFHQLKLLGQTSQKREW